MKTKSFEKKKMKKKKEKKCKRESGSIYTFWWT